MTASPSDEELMRAWCEGDDQAFRALFERLSPSVLGIARRFGLDPHSADDVVQRTFLALHEARGDFRPGARLRPWFFTIAYNVVRHELRRRGARREVAYPLELVLAEETVDGRDRLTVVGAVRSAVAALPAGCREVIELHWLERLPFREVAERVGATEGAVRVRAHRGYQALRAALAHVTELWEPA
jgi:RNA polymerase sigma-70 factor (ECF subfamily)